MTTAVIIATAAALVNRKPKEEAFVFNNLSDLTEDELKRLMGKGGSIRKFIKKHPKEAKQLGLGRSTLYRELQYFKATD